MTKAYRVRILWLVVGFVGVALVIVGKLYQVQVMNRASYERKADRQYVAQDGLFERGSIFFTTKDGDRIAAATTRQGFVLYLVPSEIADATSTYAALNAVAPIEREFFFARAAKKGDPYEPIVPHLTQDQADAVEKLGLPGVNMHRDAWRLYPGGKLASNVLGFVSYKDEALIGRYGLERQFEETLVRDTDDAFVNFFVELFANVKKTVSGEGREGDVVTTIEPVVQEHIEQVAIDISARFSSQRTGIVVMDPMTGAIVGMAMDPSFDPNNFGDVEDYGVFTNPLVEGVYELGSIMKPITMAIGLDQGVVSPESTYEDKGSLTLDGRTFYNFDKKVRGVVTMQDVLNNSLNTGVAHVVRLLGSDRFGDYMKRILGTKTGIDLPNEGTPQVDNLNSPRDIEYATASFGQGVAISPIAMTRALAALGNGGILVKPHVVEEVKFSVGPAKKFDPGTPERIFKAETSEDISRMLVTVMDEALIGGAYSMPQYTIAAKTGTAQMAADSGGYLEDRYLHSFFGYFPAYKPRFIVFIYTVDPKGVTYASHTLTEPFVDITKFLLNYYQVPPDRNLDEGTEADDSDDTSD